eukprot:jgi/Hompol1/1118/HPOL_002643-RA
MADSSINATLANFYESIGLKHLDEHAWQIVAFAILMHLVFLGGCAVSGALRISHYEKLSASKKGSWGMHIVSMVFSLLVVGLALPVVTTPELAADRVFGRSYYSGLLHAIACGYFLWDIFISLYYLKESGLGFVLHGVACFTVFVLSYRPFVQYFGAYFLLFEISTIFLNIHWFCDKTDRSGTRLQWINGVVLLFAFFSVRIVMGFYQSWQFYVACFEQWDNVPKGLFAVYSVANTILCSLNVWWFSRMIKSIVSRFNGKEDEQKEGNYGSFKAKTEKHAAQVDPVGKSTATSTAFASGSGSGSISQATARKKRD